MIGRSDESFRAGADDGQEVAEIMRQPAGELAQGFHFLQLIHVLPELVLLLLGPPSLGDVDACADDILDAAVVSRQSRVGP